MKSCIDKIQIGDILVYGINATGLLVEANSADKVSLGQIKVVGVECHGGFVRYLSGVGYNKPSWLYANEIVRINKKAK